MVNISVGVLATVISVITLLLATFSHKICENIAFQFMHTRLSSKRRAPFFTSNDLWLPNIISSLFKFRRYPGILITVCLATLLIVAELVLELGVGVTSNCAPIVRRGPLIDNANPVVSKILPWHVPDIELSAYSLLIQMVKFRDGELKHVSKGFPRRISNNLCVKCLPKPTPENTVASNCTVGPLEAVHGVSIGVMMSNGALIAITTGINVTTKSGNGTNVLSVYQGAGDLIQSAYQAGFATFFSKDKSTSFYELSNGKTIQYWEYANQEHISQLADAAFMAYQKHNRSNATNQDGANKYGIPHSSADKIITEPARGPVYRRTISCTTNRIHVGQFIRALLIYRTIQMDNIKVHMDISKAEGNRINENGLFVPLTVAEVYRAILSVKVGELMSETEVGEFFEYPQCATYNWIFAIPTLTSLFLINALGLFVVSRGRKKDEDINGGIRTPRKIENALNLLRDIDSFVNSKKVLDCSLNEWNERLKEKYGNENLKGPKEMLNDPSVVSHDIHPTRSPNSFKNSQSTARAMSPRKRLLSSWNGNQGLFSNGNFIVYLDDVNNQSPFQSASNQKMDTSQNSKDSFASICSQSDGESESRQSSSSKSRQNLNSININNCINPAISENINTNENVNGFRQQSRWFGEIPWFKEANQISVVHDQYSKISGLQVQPFEQSLLR